MGALQPEIGNNLVLGNNARGEPIDFSASARGRHLYAVGATRTGKSKFLESLIQQDILNWAYTGCGVVVLDWHGTLYENIVAWAAAENLSGWPIIPFELRRQDWCISYNLLRKRGVGDPAVIVNGFVRAMLHSWGQTNTSETPRLGKWLRTILFTLYAGNYTLAEAEQLISSREIRRQMIANVEDLVARTVWATAPRTEDGFQEMVDSAVSRLLKFLGTEVVRACLCQAEASLDLGNVLERGSILLVSLSREGATFDEEDASTFGSLILSDLWTAAQTRGKREEGERKPTYVFIDEFQEFLTPTMAKTLDQASGFDLHFTLAHQFPSQLLRQTGERAVYDSVMANARSKVVFQLEHPEDLEMLALMQFRREINTDEIKYQGDSTKVMGYQLKYVKGFSQSTTDAIAESQGQNWSKGASSGGSTAHGTSHTSGSGGGSVEGMTEGLSFQIDPAVDTGFGLVFGNSNSPQTISNSNLAQTSESWSQGDSENFIETESWAMTEMEGGSEATARSKAKTVGESLIPTYEPQMGKEKQAPIYRTVQEQVFRATQFLSSLPDRYCVVRIVGEPRSMLMMTRTIPRPLTTPEWTEEFLQSFLKSLEFALPLKDAISRITARAELMRKPFAAEPATVRRKVGPRPSV
jgi:hypothetical protein